MRFLAMILIGSLAGCGASPDSAFRDAARSEVAINGYRFVVFHHADAAEVIRLGYLAPRARDRVPALMEVAAEQATGCLVVGPLRGYERSPSLPGDSGEARFEIAC